MLRAKCFSSVVCIFDVIIISLLVKWDLKVNSMSNSISACSICLLLVTAFPSFHTNRFLFFPLQVESQNCLVLPRDSSVVLILLWNAFCLGKWTSKRFNYQVSPLAFSYFFFPPCSQFPFLHYFSSPLLLHLQRWHILVKSCAEFGFLYRQAKLCLQC